MTRSPAITLRDFVETVLPDEPPSALAPEYQRALAAHLDRAEAALEREAFGNTATHIGIAAAPPPLTLARLEELVRATRPPPGAPLLVSALAPPTPIAADVPGIGRVVLVTYELAKHIDAQVPLRLVRVLSPNSALFDVAGHPLAGTVPLHPPPYEAPDR